MNNNKLYKFFSIKTTLEEEKEILDWLEKSSENQHEFLKARNLYDMVLLHADNEHAGLERKTQRMFPRWVKEVVKVVAVFLILLGLNFYYRGQQEKLSMAINTVTVPPGQRVNLELPDGTKVCMNACSELKYPALFAKSNRKVELKGEAYFEVTHNQSKPFIVETELCDVEALGTTFNVEAYPGSGKISTALLSGKVKVTNRRDTNKQVILKPDQEANFTNNEFLINQIQYRDHLRWREGLICFQTTSLAGLIKEFEKYYAVHIEIEKKEILSHELSGKLKINDGIDHALRVLQKNIPFIYVWDKVNDNIIYIK
jgi:ferric-dicitrate binding protein FerR (iron transport regulator)